MQLKILFLLMGGLCIATAVSVGEIVEDLEQFLKQENGHPIDSNHHLTILPNRLGSTDDSLVWEALFDGQKVAIKIHTNQSRFAQETAGYRAANATDDPTIGSRGIPRIYYTGTIFEKRYPVIVMTRFDETLFDRWMKQNRSFNAYSTLEVFLQMAKTLTYLQSRGVIHNDIKPKNIFLRGSKVFLGNFGVATFNGEQTLHGSDTFGSSGYLRRMRNPETPFTFMDDLKSLAYTIWFIERIHYIEPSGLIISSGRDNESFVMEKCEHFKKFPRSFKALKFICHDEMLSRKPVPDYESIVNHLTKALADVKRLTGQKSFEWLDYASSASLASSFTFG